VLRGAETALSPRRYPTSPTKRSGESFLQPAAWLASSTIYEAATSPSRACNRLSCSSRVQKGAGSASATAGLVCLHPRRTGDDSSTRFETWKPNAACTSVDGPAGPHFKGLFSDHAPLWVRQVELEHISFVLGAGIRGDRKNRSRRARDSPVPDALRHDDDAVARGAPGPSSRIGKRAQERNGEEFVPISRPTRCATSRRYSASVRQVCRPSQNRTID